VCKANIIICKIDPESLILEKHCYSNSFNKTHYYLILPGRSDSLFEPCYIALCELEAGSNQNLELNAQEEGRERYFSEALADMQDGYKLFSGSTGSLQSNSRGTKQLQWKYGWTSLS